MKNTLCALVTGLAISIAACDTNNAEDLCRYNGRPGYTATSNYQRNCPDLKSNYETKTDYRTNNSPLDNSGSDMMLWWVVLSGAL
ncbi:MAG: hypothetical protein WCV90_07905 [Candidatus Woesearchaeota archaeon]